MEYEILILYNTGKIKTRGVFNSLSFGFWVQIRLRADRYVKVFFSVFYVYKIT